MDAVEAKIHAFRARWLGVSDGLSNEGLNEAPSTPTGPPMRAPSRLIPRVIFREQAVADRPPVRRAPLLKRSRLVRGAVQIVIVVAAVAATSVGFQKMFKAAPDYLSTFTSAFESRGAASVRS